MLINSRDCKLTRITNLLGRDLVLSEFELALQNLPFRSTRARVSLPQPNAAKKRVTIVAQLDALRQLVQLLGIATTQHNVVGNERLLQLHQGVLNVALPGFLTQNRAAIISKIILNGAAGTIRQVPQFERQDILIPHQRGPQPGTESEK